MPRSSRREKFYDELYGEETKTEYSPAQVEKNGPETRNGIIINSLFVKVRRRPSLESDIAELLRKGDRVHIIEKVGDFYKIETSVNKDVYISSKFIKEE